MFDKRYKFIFYHKSIIHHHNMNNKTIWITGASSGIGKALAIKFAQEGWKVAISARRENLLKEI